MLPTSLFIETPNTYTTTHNSPWARLIKIDGLEKHPEHIELNKHVFKVGRRGIIDTYIVDPRISAIQLIIVYDEYRGKVMCTDSSSNGTFINGERIKGQTRELLDGDVLKFVQRVPLISYRFEILKSVKMREYEKALKEAMQESETLSPFYLSEELSDFKIEVKCDRKVFGKSFVIFPAHKIIVFGKCPVLKAMLKHPFKEKSESRVCVSDTDPYIVQAMLYFMYKRDIQTHRFPLNFEVNDIKKGNFKSNLAEIKSENIKNDSKNVSLIKKSRKRSRNKENVCEQSKIQKLDTNLNKRYSYLDTNRNESRLSDEQTESEQVDIIFLFRLLIAADKYQILTLYKLCSLRILAEINLRNICEVICFMSNELVGFADNACYLKIWNECLDFVVKNIKMFRKCPLYERVMEKKRIREAILDRFIDRYSI